MRVTGPTAFFGAVSGFLGVAIGAFGAHAIADPQAKEWIATGAHYHMLHTMAAFASMSFRNWGAKRAHYAPVFFLPGILLFSGSLYALAFGAPRWVAFITPMGGFMFLIGWGVLAVCGWDLCRASQAWKRRQSSNEVAAND